MFARTHGGSKSNHTTDSIQRRSLRMRAYPHPLSPSGRLTSRRATSGGFFSSESTRRAIVTRSRKKPTFGPRSSSPIHKSKSQPPANNFSNYGHRYVRTSLQKYRRRSAEG